MVKVCRLKGNVTRAKLWLKELPMVKLRRLIGSVKPAKLWLKRCPKVSVCKLLGSVTPAKLWLNERPKVKLCSLLGSVTRARLLLKSHPKVNVCNVPGNVTRSKLWLNMCPKVKLCRVLGNVTPTKLLLKSHPKVNVSRLFDSVTPFNGLLNISPRVNTFRLLGNVTSDKLLLKSHPKVNVCNIPGNVTPAKLWLNKSPKVSVWHAKHTSQTTSSGYSATTCQTKVFQMHIGQWNNCFDCVQIYCGEHGRLLGFYGSLETLDNLTEMHSLDDESDFLILHLWQQCFGVLEDIATWSQQQLSSFCTCGSSVLESSRILQPEVSSNFLPGFRPIFSEMYLYTYSTVASSSAAERFVHPIPWCILMLNEFTSTLGSAAAHVSTTRRLRSDLCSSKWDYFSIENSRKHVWNCLFGKPKKIEAGKITTKIVRNHDRSHSYLFGAYYVRM